MHAKRPEKQGVNTDPTVLLVDDDRELRESIEWMLRREGILVEAYSAPEELLACYQPEKPGCLVLDLKLPGMSGVELCNELQKMGGHHPFIMISGHGDVPNAVEAMRTGAIDFIQKPFSRPKFLARVHQAIERDSHVRKRRRKQRELNDRLETLTPREREVLDLVVDGELTKNIARRLGISPKTVEVHRSHITSKMGVASTTHLVRMVVESSSLSQTDDS